jgi:hypothetical protein
MMVIESYAIAGSSLCLSSCATTIQTALSRTIGQVSYKFIVLFISFDSASLLFIGNLFLIIIYIFWYLCLSS